MDSERPCVLSSAGGITLSSQIDDIFRKKIISGEWASDQRIPSELQLAQRYNVSRSTIRTVVLQLVGEGLLYRVPGKGTFVSPSRGAMSFQTLNLRGKLDQVLPSAYSLVVHAGFSEPPDLIRSYFGLPERAQLYCLERVRYRTVTAIVPYIYQYNYLLPEIAPKLDLETLPTVRLTHQLRDRAGLTPARMAEWLEASGATDVEAQALKVAPGTPVMMMDELSYDKDGRPYNFNRFVFPASQLRLSFT